MGKKHTNGSFQSGNTDGSDGRGERDQHQREQDASAPNPSELLPALDERNLGTLRRVGREWSRFCGNPEVWRDALPVDPSLGTYPDFAEIQPTLF